MTNDLEIRYNAYLTAINERRFDDLVQHVHEELTYNGSPMTVKQYQELITASVSAMPDLFFNPQLLVAADHQVACRLVYDCTLQGELFGYTGDGARLHFAEHAFYRYRDGRIAVVESLFDSAAIAQQLSAQGQENS